MSDTYFDGLEKSLCTGCSLCKTICPKHCIQMSSDETGFYYPVIDYDKCIKCNLCAKTCPQNIQMESNKQNIFYGYSNNKNTLNTTSSGGIFSEIAAHFIKRQGVVYGAAYTDKFTVKHIRVDSIRDIELLKGSKYVQSDIENIFSSVEKDLNDKRYVLFSGTPCQIAALINKTGKSKYLYTIDIICHGVPSEKLWQDFLKIFKQNENISFINFRNKEKYYWGNSFKMITDKRVVIENCRNISYYSLFEDNMILRPSCFSCKYANMNRVGDITLGDYWGVERIENINYEEYKEGISLIITNTKKGMDLLNEVINFIKLNPVSGDTFLKFNPNLMKSTDKPKLYDEFMCDYVNNGYSFVEEKYYRNNPPKKNFPLPKILKFYIKKKVKHI